MHTPLVIVWGIGFNSIFPAYAGDKPIYSQNIYDCL